MENKAKRFLRLLLAIAMVMAIMPMTFALATETGNVAQIGTQGYESLAEAIEDANAIDGGATVVMLQDVTLSEKLTISGNVTISGVHTITRADTYTGTLFAVNAGATLTLDGGLVIDGGNDWSYIKGEPELDMANGSGTKVVNHITPAEGGVNATAHLIVNKGTLNANTTTIQNSYSTNGVSAIECGANSVTVLDGATIKHVAANRSGAVVYVGGVDAVLTIKGNTRITDNFGISNGGIIQNYGQGTTVNMEGGSIDHNYVGKSGTLYASYSDSANKINTFNMSGGIITQNKMEGYGPVYIHTNTVWNMTGGEISYNTSYLPTYVRSKNNAATISGGKIVNNEIAGTDYNNGSYATRPDIYLGTNSKITGGIFTQNVNEYCAEGFVCKQLADGTWRIEERTTVSVTVTIQNATMVKGNALPNFTYTTDVECPELDISYTVDGTAINAIVAEMDGYEFTVIPGTLTVQKAIVRVEANGTKAFFATLEDAIKYAVKATGYVGVHILGDVTVNETIVINDANGGTIELQAFPSSYKITSTMNSELFRVEKTTSFVVKNLTIRAKGDAFYIAGGSLTLQGVGDNSQYLVVTSETGNAIYTRGGNTIVKGGVTLIAHGEYPAIQGNGLYEGNVTLAKWGGYPGVPQVSAPNTDIAIFWPQNGKLTIDAGTITGDTALYAKSGTIIINGGEFYGTGTKVDFAHNSNGAYATGDAVVIESCKDAAYETPVVTIKGGKFVSDNADAIGVYNCNEAKPMTKFISGGLFSSAPAPEWCAEGMGPKHAEDNMWTVGTGIVTVDGVYFDDWKVAKTYIKGSSVIVLYANVENEGPFSVGAMYKTVTLDLNGHKFTTTNIGVDGHKTLHITDSGKNGSVVVTNYTALYVNGYLDIDSDIDFNSKIQINYHSDATPSTGCLLIDGNKWIGRGHFGQEDGIIGTTGGYVTIKNNFQSITFNSGKFFLNDTADFTQFAANEGITVNADATIDLKGKLLKTDAIVCFSELIDTATTAGGVVVSPESVSLMQNKTYMPIYDSANGCFRVYEFTMISKGVQQQGNGTVAKFGIAIQFTNVNAYYVLATTENAHLDMTFTLTWENMGELDPLVYTFTGEAVRKWAGNAYTYYSNPNNTKDWALTLTVGGLEKLPEGNHLTIAPAVNSTVKKITFTASSDKIVAAPAVIAQPGGATDATQKNDEGDGEGDSTGAQNQ